MYLDTIQKPGDPDGTPGLAQENASQVGIAAARTKAPQETPGDSVLCRAEVLRRPWCPCRLSTYIAPPNAIRACLAHSL